MAKATTERLKLADCTHSFDVSANENMTPMLAKALIAALTFAMAELH
jgi:hypothetical protein